jgi:hypothetical protein
LQSRAGHTQLILLGFISGDIRFDVCDLPSQ